MPKKIKQAHLSYKRSAKKLRLSSSTYIAKYPLPPNAPIIISGNLPVLGLAEASKPFTTHPLLHLDLTIDQEAILQSLDSTFAPNPSQLSKAAVVLKDHNLTLKLITSLLNTVDIANTSRLIALTKAPDLLEAMDKGLTMGQARVLVKLTPTERARLTTAALSRSLSVNALKALISPSIKPQAIDTSIIENQLSEALKTPVKLDWPEQGMKKLKLTYFTTEELQGMLEQLLRFSGNSQLSNKTIKRELVIEIADTGEFELLLGNLPAL